MRSLGEQIPAAGSHDKARTSVALHPMSIHCISGIVDGREILKGKFVDIYV